MSDQHHLAAVINLIEAYFIGLYHSDSKILTDVFHPDARYVNTYDGDYMNISMPEYFERIDQRSPPAKTHETRSEKIISITIDGDRMAFVKLTMTMFGREYLDLLTLTYDHHGWRIMSKVFTYIPKPQEQ